MRNSNLNIKEKIIIFSFPLLVLFYDLIIIVLNKFPLQLYKYTPLYFILISCFLIFIFIMASYILMKIIGIDIILAYPIWFIIFLRLSIHEVYPVFINSLIPVSVATIISIFIIFLAYKNKITISQYFQYNLSTFILFLLFIQSNLFIFIIILLVPFLLLLRKRVFSILHENIFIIFPITIILILYLFFYDKSISAPQFKTTSKLKSPNNVILIVIDTARKDCIDINSEDTVTPTLKKFAEEGKAINKFIANGAWTPPAHASIFTGLLPSDNGVFHFNNENGVTSLSNKLTTLAEILQKNRIHTGGFVANPYLNKIFGFAQGFNKYEFISPKLAPITISILNRNLERLIKYYPKYFLKYASYFRYNYNNIALSDKVLNRAIEWIKNNNKEQSFFLFINLMEQHYIRYFYDPSDGILHIGPKYYYENKDTLYYRPGSLKNKNKRLLNWHKLTIKNIDYHLGLFFDELKNLGFYKNTTIIITADHGNLFGEFNHYDHQDNIYAQNVFVPFIIKYAINLRNRYINPRRLFQQVDIFAEILDLFNIKTPKYIYGKRFNEKNGNIVITQLYRIYNNKMWMLNKDLCGIYIKIKGNYYQMIISSDGKHELYHINNFKNTDKNNLHEKLKRNHIIIRNLKKFSRILKRKIYENNSVNKEDIRRKLKSLGYIK